MRTFAFFWAILWSLNAPAQSLDPLDPGSADGAGSIRGELEFTPANEPTQKIQYQYGAVPAIESGDSQKLIPLADNLEKVETGLGLSKEVIVYEEEGAAPSELPVQISSKVKVEHVKIPRSLIAKVKQVFKDSYVEPKPAEWVMGAFFFTVRAALSGTVWFSTPGVSPEIALLMTAAGASLTATSTIYNQTYTNLYGYALPITAPGEKTPGSVYGKIWSRQTLYDLSVTNLLNVLSGMRNSVAQTTINTLISGAVGNTYATKRNVLLRARGKPHLNLAMSLIASPILFVLQGKEAAGHLKAVFDIGSYHVRSTMIETFAVYTALIIATSAAPNQLIRILEKINTKMNFAIAGAIYHFRQVSDGFCDALLR